MTHCDTTHNIVRSVLSHTSLDALMMQAVFEPDILAFWEALTGKYAYFMLCCVV